MPTIGEIDDYFKKLDLGKKYDLSSLKIVPDTRTVLTKEEKEAYVAYFEELITKHAEQLGDFSYAINSNSPHDVTLSLISFAKKTSTIIGRKPVYKQGNLVGKTCDFCKEKVRCVVSEHNVCAVEEDFQPKYNAHMQTAHYFTAANETYFKDVLKAEGFAIKPFLGIEELAVYDDMWEKDRLVVYLS